jgi:hypothetical protein
MSNKITAQPLLVTGVHRSGTTWVGRMLATSHQCAYISEPLNVFHRPSVFSASTPYWYTYICKDNEDAFLPAFQDTLRFRYHLVSEIRSLRSRKDVGRMLRDAAVFGQGWLRRQRPLLKDPFASFSIPWFIERLNCQVVVTLRHPAAFVSSVKRLGWIFQVEDLLAQELLMRDWLAPFESELRQAASQANNLIGRASLLWRVIYHVIAQLQNQYPAVIIVRHEDLAEDPLPAYRELYSQLNLAFTPAVEQDILGSSSSENPREQSSGQAYATRLDSRASLLNWKHRLEPAEIQRIRELTMDVAQHYYPDFQWD